jgi:hypothetical protein
MDRTEPRLWVKRLILWKEPGVMLREISLRPGLNIIWSPDPGEQINEHGSHPWGMEAGKPFLPPTPVLSGEDRSSPDEQRMRIAQAFPKALLGPR